MELEREAYELVLGCRSDLLLTITIKLYFEVNAIICVTASRIPTGPESRRTATESHLKGDTAGRLQIKLKPINLPCVISLSASVMNPNLRFDL